MVYTTAILYEFLHHAFIICLSLRYHYKAALVSGTRFTNDFREGSGDSVMIQRFTEGVNV